MRADARRRRTAPRERDVLAVIGKTLLRDAGPFSVKSYVGGVLEIRPAYTGHQPPHHAPHSPYDGPCPHCDCRHIGGFVSRMALASRIEDVLNRLYRAARPAKRRKKR